MSFEDSFGINSAIVISLNTSWGWVEESSSFHGLVLTQERNYESRFWS